MTGDTRSPGEVLGQSETKYFSIEDVVKRIELIAQADGIEAGDLKPEAGKAKYDDKGNLLYFPLQLDQERAREKKSGNIWYIYMVKGVPGPIGALDLTSIMKAEATLEEPDEVYYTTVVLEYNDAKDEWKPQ